MKAKELFHNTTLNTVGLVLYFFAQWLTTVIAVRLGSFEIAGLYALVISFCNVFYYLALFGIRNFQISDVDSKYSFGQFNGTRILCGSISGLLCVGIVLLKKQSVVISLCYIIYFIFKMGEAFTEGHFSILQLKNRYDLIFLSYLAKAIIPLGLFTIFLWKTKQLLSAILAMTGGYYLALLFIDLPYYRKKDNIKPTLRGIWSILRICIPLFLVSLTVPIMNYATRAAVEKELGYYALGQYASLSSVLVVMSTMAGAVFLVLIPEISAYWKTNQQKRILLLFAYVLIAMILFGGAALVVGKYFGAMVCRLIFGEQILSEIGLLIPLLISATILMCKSFFSSVLVPLERYKLLMAGEFSGMLLCVLTAGPFTAHWGMYGTNISYLSGLLLQLVLLGSFSFVTVTGKFEVKKHAQS